MTHTELCERAIDTLDSMKDETRRKAEYCVDQIMYHIREDADTALLANTLERILA